MSKMRVYEYAKQNNLTSKQVIEQLNKLNIDISNHMSTITSDIQEMLDKSFKKDSQPKETKQEKKTKKSSSEKNNKAVKEDREETNVITYSGSLNVSQLADKLNKDTNEILKKLLLLGVMANKNQNLDEDTIE